jgi:multidrug efflux pump subunit AcrA (membrane-fusion protein)
MPDTLKKVLLGAVAGALLVGFVWHAMSERAKRGPLMSGAVVTPGKPGGPGAPGMGGAPTGVIAVPARIERLALELEALGTAKASESVDITARTSNLVTVVHFTEGQQVRRGDVLVEMDSQQARADMAIAEAALKESTSQYHRSRELYTTKVLSDAQLEQIEAAFKSNEARVAAARARLADTVVRAPFAGRVGLRRISVGSLVNPGAVMTTRPRDRREESRVSGAVVCRQGVERRFKGGPGHTLGDRSRDRAESGGRPEARHVPHRAHDPQ